MSAAPKPRHFLDLDRLDGATLRSILTSADAIKANRDSARPLAGKQVALIFEKPSTRTRVSFEVGVRQLGGEAVVLNASEMQLGRGESVADTARVLSRYVDAIMLRANSHHTLLELAEHATVPVINGLTDRSHPCQIMADVMTIEERKGSIEGARSPGSAMATMSRTRSSMPRSACASACAWPVPTAIGPIPR